MGTEASLEKARSLLQNAHTLPGGIIPVPPRGPKPIPPSVPSNSVAARPKRIAPLSTPRKLTNEDQTSTRWDALKEGMEESYVKSRRKSNPAAIGVRHLIADACSKRWDAMKDGMEESYV